MKSIKPLLFAWLVVLSAQSVTVVHAQIIARWDTNSTNSTGPSAEDWDGWAGNNVGGVDNYSFIGANPPNDDDGINDPNNTGRGSFGDQFYYIQGTGTAPGPKGRWENAMASVNVQSLPSGERMVVQPLTPTGTGTTGHDFLDDTFGGVEGHQINLGRNTILDNLVHNFSIETQFTAGSLVPNGSGSDASIILGYDHAKGGASNSVRFDEGFKFGVSSNRVHLTIFGEVDASWDTTLVAGIQYKLRMELSDNGAGQTEVEPFLDGSSLGMRTYDNINAVTATDTVGDAQHEDGVAHLNNWYIGSGGTGQYFDGQISYVQLGVVPEPSSMLLLGIGSLGLLYRRRR